MKVSIIVAADQNLAIGKNNELPWHLPKDLKFFKQTTMGHHMIMGRKTIESIGKALPGRTSIVITRQEDYQFPGAVVVHAFQEAIDFAASQDETEVFVIGGAEVINEMVPQADTIYFTQVKTVVDGTDVFLHKFDPTEWEETERESHPADEKHAYPFDFVTYRKK